MLIYNDNLQFVPETAGVYPILLPLDCTSMQGFDYLDHVSRIRTKFKRVYKAGNVWYVDMTKSYDVTVDWDSEPKVKRESADITMQITPHLATRWYSYKPVVRAHIVKITEDSTTIRITLNGGDTVDFTSERSYFARKARDCVLGSFPYQASEANGLGIYGPDMPLEKRELLRTLLPHCQRIQDLNWIPSWQDIRYDLAPYYMRGSIDYLALLEGGLIPHLPACNSSKPFAKGSSFSMKIIPGMFCLVSEVTNTNDKLVKFLEDAGSTNIDRDIDIIRAMTNPNRDVYLPSAFTSKLVDTYGVGICCIGTCFLKAVPKEKVLERYAKQEPTL